jgi:hypothetical protein
MSKSVLEKLAISFAVLVFTSAIWFWSRQVGDVLETLKLAAGAG